jgi:predicted 3-demethylubiquinone-9 3-methyltransferase (glyoxalase superfamily)
VAKITPFLWFDNNAEEAMNFYISVFNDGEVLDTVRYTDAGPGPAGSVVTVTFRINGQEFTAINGGPHFRFTEAVSFAIDCKDQEEVDYYWEKLTEGGEESQCGWLKDKYGLSWQVVPTELIEVLKDPDTTKASRAATALFQMRRIDIAAIRAAVSAG